MKDVLVEIHTIWRWVVILVSIGALYFSLMSAANRRPWDSLADRFSLFMTIAFDVQVLVGLALWVVEQRWGDDIYLGYIHPVLMLIAAALAHLGRIRSEREKASVEKGRVAALFFAAAIVVVILAVPLAAWPL